MSETNGANARLKGGEAQRLLDQAIEFMGFEPDEVTAQDGWWELTYERALCRTNIIDWDGETEVLVIWAPLVRAPVRTELRLKLLETLLHYNADFVSTGRLALSESDLVILTWLERADRLRLEGVIEALSWMLRAANHLKELLEEVILDLPRLELDEEVQAGLRVVFRQCEPAAQGVLRQLLEGWVAQGSEIGVGQDSIHLKSGGDRNLTLATVVGHSAAGPVITVVGAILEKLGLSAAQVESFRAALPRPKGFEQTTLWTHLLLNESFTPAMGEQLLAALTDLSAQLATAEPVEPPPLPDLATYWGLQIKVGGATQRGIDSLLAACPEAVQAIYVKLIQGWFDAGQKLYTKNTDRVALRLSVNQGTFALVTLFGPQKKRAPRIELHYPTTYYIGDHPAGEVYEAAVAALPGFEQHNSGARLAMGERFGLADSERLLAPITELAAHV
jgi:hypothetical protein